MKKAEKYIFIVIGIIIGGVIASGITYMLVTEDSDNNKTNENDRQNQAENNKDNEQDNNDDKDEEENKSDDVKVVISEEKLEEYLSYVPVNVAYDIKSINIKNVKEEDLIAYVASQLHYDYDDDAGDLSEIPISELHNFVNKKYNRNITIKDTKELSEGMYNYDYALCFYYTNGSDYLSGNMCGSGSNYLTIADNYEISNGDLIIYGFAVEYTFEYDGIISQDIIIDMYTKDEWDFNDELTEEKVRTYLNNNKSKFTQYKHTFKKNGSEYYWYSTEVVEN